MATEISAAIPHDIALGSGTDALSSLTCCSQPDDQALEGRVWGRDKTLMLSWCSCNDTLYLYMCAHRVTQALCSNTSVHLVKYFATHR